MIQKTHSFFNRPEGISNIKVPNENFKLFQDFSPIVKTQDCFDALQIPKDHVSRKPTDTYYLDEDTILRTHTSVHQIPLMKQGHNSFLCLGDVYRKDTVDKTHYPVFHQMEGVRIFKYDEIGVTNITDAKHVAGEDLK